MKNSTDTIGNRTRDLPACSAVPPPTAPTLVLFQTGKYAIISHKQVNLQCHVVSRPKGGRIAGNTSRMSQFAGTRL